MVGSVGFGSCQIRRIRPPAPVYQPPPPPPPPPPPDEPPPPLPELDPGAVEADEIALLKAEPKLDEKPADVACVPIVAAVPARRVARRLRRENAGETFRPVLLDLERKRRRQIALVELHRERRGVDQTQVVALGDVEVQAVTFDVIHHGPARDRGRLEQTTESPLTSSASAAAASATQPGFVANHQLAPKPPFDDGQHDGHRAEEQAQRDAAGVPGAVDPEKRRRVALLQHAAGAHAWRR